jgi:hypothetical protein
MITKFLRHCAIIVLFAAVGIGIWVGLWSNATIGVGLFAMLLLTAGILLLIAHVNGKIDARIAELQVQ